MSDTTPGCITRHPGSSIRSSIVPSSTPSRWTSRRPCSTRLSAGERFSWRWPNGCRAHRSTSSLVFMVSTSIRSPSPRLERHSRCGRVATLRSTRCGSATIWSMIPSQRSDSISSSGIRRSSSQLRGGTPRSQAQRAALAERWAGVGGYVDDAAAFLLAGVDALADGGTVVLVQPASVLGAVDARSVRERLARSAPPRALWVDPGRAFAAGVDTVALVCRGATLLRPLMSTAWRWIGRRRLRGHRSWRRLPVSRSCPVRPAAPRWVMSPGLRRASAISTTGSPTPSPTTPPVPIRS